MPLHCMIDKETLHTDPNAVILTIGVVLFDPCGTGIHEKLELRPTIDEQTDIYNRAISDSTLDWWATQSEEAREEALGDKDRIPYREAMERLAKFCWNKHAVWSNGATFDIILAENAFRELDIKVPWSFWNIRDCRTIYDIANVSLKDKKYGTKTTHRAVEDAEHQALVVQDAYRKLRHAGFTHLK